MDRRNGPEGITVDRLRIYGTRWAVLAAMERDIAQQGVEIPVTIEDELRVARLKIAAGCFSEHDMDSSLSKLESVLTTRCFSLSEEFFHSWSALLARARRGEIDPQRIAEIPALQPVAPACGFLHHCHT